MKNAEETINLIYVKDSSAYKEDMWEANVNFFYWDGRLVYASHLVQDILDHDRELSHIDFVIKELKQLVAYFGQTRKELHKLIELTYKKRKLLESTNLQEIKQK
jgi:hypothetical protein